MMDRREIFLLLERYGPLSISELIELTKESRRLVERIVYGLRDDGFVAKTRYGQKYELKVTA